MTLEREYERNFKKKLRTFLLENKLKFFVHGSKKKKIYFTFDILEYDYQPTISVFFLLIILVRVWHMCARVLESMHYVCVDVCECECACAYVCHY